MEKVTQKNHQKEKNINPARYAAVRILNRVERSGSYIDKLVDFELNVSSMISEDKALLQELVYGVTRWKAKLDWVLIGFFHGDFQKCFNYVKNAMRVGLYQIMFLDRVPASAAIDESVEMVKRKQGRKTAGLVNGVLRNISRNVKNIRYPKEFDDRAFYISVMESHAKWMVFRWMERWGENDTVKLLRANNKIPFTSYRVNILKTSVEEIKIRLYEMGVNYNFSPFIDTSFKNLTRNIDLTRSELFQNGLITIQDTSASLIGKLCDPKPKTKILDTCAAPGGKSIHIAELTGDKATIDSIDSFEARVGMIKENLKRMDIKSIRARHINLFEYQTKRKYDLVLLDAPCSGHGTISHKPDIKWSSERQDLTDLIKMQRRMIQKASEYVKPGGVMVYSTCTVEYEENEAIVNGFLDKNPDWEIDRSQNYLNEDLCTKDGFMQTFPHLHSCDGAFGARLIKKSDA